MARYRISISSHDREAMLDLVRKHQVNVFDHGIRRSLTQGYVVDALAYDYEIAGLEQKGYLVQRHEDVDKAGKERQREVAKGNRYLKPPSD